MTIQSMCPHLTKTLEQLQTLSSCKGKRRTDDRVLCFNTCCGLGISLEEPNALSRMSHKFKRLTGLHFSCMKAFLGSHREGCPFTRFPQGPQSAAAAASAVVAQATFGNFQMGILVHTREHKTGTWGQSRSVCISKLSKGNKTRFKNRTLRSARKAAAHI